MADKSFLKFLEANQVKLGSFTRDTTLTTGNQAITGIGFKPKAVVFFMAQHAAVGEVSWGLDDGSGHLSISDEFNIVANAYLYDNNESIFDNHSAGNTYGGYISALGSDGFTITWTKTGAAPAGTITINYIAFR